MEKIYKHTLKRTDKQIIELQADSILSVAEQNNCIVIYAMETVEFCKDNTNKFEIRIVGTGQPIDFYAYNYTFVGTVSVLNGQLMYHVFYRKENYVESR